MLLVSFQKNPSNFEVLLNFCNTAFHAEGLVIMYSPKSWRISFASVPWLIFKYILTYRPCVKVIISIFGPWICHAMVTYIGKSKAIPLQAWTDP
jgi:hypothetical protein